MRQLTHRLQRDRLAPRGKPRPRWLRPVQIATLLVVAAAGLGAAFDRLDRMGVLAGLRDGGIAAALGWSGAAGLVVERVYAEGRTRTTEAEIVSALGRYQGERLLEVDLDVVRQRLEALPWVREATVVRQLPDTLIGRIVEHRPVAVWQHDGQRRLLGSAGETIPVGDLRGFARLPVLAGAGAPDRAGELFAALAGAPDLARRVSQAALVGERRWNVWLDRRIEVRLPEAGLEEAWRFLATRQRETSLLARAIELIDLRRPDWLVVRLLGEPTVATAAQGQGA